MSNFTQDATHQPDANAESGASEHAGGGEGEGMGGDAGVQASGGEANTETLGTHDLPPEMQEVQKKLMQDYHAKTQKLAEKTRQFEGELSQHKNNSQILGQLMDQDWFKKAYEQEKNKRNGGIVAEDLSDEQFDAIRNDKRAFADYLRKFAETVAENRVGTKLNNTEAELRALKTDRVKDQLGATYKDFKPAFDAGHLDKYLSQGSSLESAYALWKVKEAGATSKNDVLGEAERLLAARKAGAVERPGSAQPRGAERVYKARSLHDALDVAFKARERGETNFRITKE